MNIVDIKCPHCGGELHIGNDRKDCFCEYCGSHLFFDNGDRTVTNINVIRDEARIKEAEVNLKRLENTELEKHRIDKLTEAEIKKAKIAARAANKGSSDWFRNILKIIWLVSLVVQILIVNFRSNKPYAAFIGTITYQDVFNLSFILLIITSFVLLVTHRRRK